jgi:uncharacterized damage-inducible protein DinB
VLEALSRVSAECAQWKPSPTANSIWQIVDHVTASKRWQVDMLKSGSATSPAWRDPEGDDAAWSEAIVRLKDAHAALKVAVAGLSDEDLLRPPAYDSAQTLLVLLLSAASAHESHHGGQIDYLKGLFG